MLDVIARAFVEDPPPLVDIGLMSPSSSALSRGTSCSVALSNSSGEVRASVLVNGVSIMASQGTTTSRV